MQRLYILTKGVFGCYLSFDVFFYNNDTPFFRKIYKMHNEKKHNSKSQPFLIIILISVAVYYLFMLATCNRNRTFIRIIEEKYPKIYEEVMEEAEEIEADKSESQIRR